MFPVLFLYQRKNVDIALGPTQGPTLAYPNQPSLSGAPDGPPGCSGTLCKAPGALGIWLLLKVPCSPPGLLRQVAAERSALTELGNRPLSGR